MRRGRPTVRSPTFHVLRRLAYPSGGRFPRRRNRTTPLEGGERTSEQSGSADSPVVRSSQIVGGTTAGGHVARPARPLASGTRRLALPEWERSRLTRYVQASKDH